MEKLQKTELFKAFVDHLKSLIKEPPYSIFIFISPILLIITLFWRDYFEIFIIFFFYSVFGIVFRHAVKDFRGRIKESCKNNKITSLDSDKKFTRIDLWLTGIYQSVNLVLVVVLIVIIIILFTTSK
ncbi:MAG: hypothetical protein A2998_02860 [Candidatus Staskawiczbacteria bacterium RIFCSPLOWO2_01_FULL_37_25b]|uniref:DUF3899 domain-containing protein n=1 Tax=Candidatus Staskawiczbacteria bacterium RIFCSPLOWO2_01_FULL_37_25b TaxID=1802213 RepID=A0A1G2IJ17_9BACT|nr:MAG: hypothetical protein A2998_02860 [Candidatus Staskawiczbacteria bacterium RIFCSPLOWO2_01_FULL_37_25b]